MSHAEVLCVMFEVLSIIKIDAFVSDTDKDYRHEGKGEVSFDSMSLNPPML